MNKIYKVVFNKVLGVFTAVSELAGHKGKKSAKTVIASAMVGLAIASVAPVATAAQELGAVVNSLEQPINTFDGYEAGDKLESKSSKLLYIEDVPVGMYMGTKDKPNPTDLAISFKSIVENSDADMFYMGDVGEPARAGFKDELYVRGNYNDSIDDLSDGNIAVVSENHAENGGVLTIKLAENLKNLNSVDTQTLTADQEVQTPSIKLGDETTNTNITYNSDKDRIQYQTDGGTTKQLATLDDISGSEPVTMAGTNGGSGTGKIVYMQGETNVGNIKAGDNLVFAASGTGNKDTTISLADEIKVTSVETTNVTLGTGDNTTNITYNSNDNRIVYNTEIEGETVTKKVATTDDVNGKTVTMEAGTNSAVIKQGDTTVGTIQGGDTVTIGKSATSNVYTIDAKATTYKGDSGTGAVVAPGETLNIKGGATGTLTDGNIGIVGSADDNTLTVKLNETVSVKNVNASDNVTVGGDTGTKITGTKVETTYVDANSVDANVVVTEKITLGTEQTHTDIQYVESKEGDKTVGRVTYNDSTTTQKIANLNDLSALENKIKEEIGGGGAVEGISYSGKQETVDGKSTFTIKATQDKGKETEKTIDVGSMTLNEGHNISIKSSDSYGTAATIALSDDIDVKSVTTNEITLGGDQKSTNITFNYNDGRIEYKTGEGEETKTKQVATLDDVNGKTVTMTGTDTTDKKAGVIDMKQGGESYGTITSGKNIVFKASGDNKENTSIALSDDISVNNVDVNNEVNVGGEGGTTINKTDVTTTNVYAKNLNLKDGDHTTNIAYNYQDNRITYTTEKGEQTITEELATKSDVDGMAVTMSTDQSEKSVTLIQGAGEKATTIGTIKAGETMEMSVAATPRNADATPVVTLNAKSTTYAGDSGTAAVVAPGQTLNIKGADANIKVIGKGTDGLAVKLNDTINVTNVNASNQVQVGGAGGTTINKTEVKTKNVTAEKVQVGSVVMTDKGLDNGGNKITNVADGEADNDAATVGQVKDMIGGGGGGFNTADLERQFNARFKDMDNRINEVEDDANAGTAMALAAAALPQVYQAGKSMVAVSGGTYRGQQGYALGFSHSTSDGRWIFKANATGNTQGHYGGAVGAGYMW